jgi:hypothetical protein
MALDSSTMALDSSTMALDFLNTALDDEMEDLDRDLATFFDNTATIGSQRRQAPFLKRWKA